MSLPRSSVRHFPGRRLVGVAALVLSLPLLVLSLHAFAVADRGPAAPALRGAQVQAAETGELRQLAPGLWHLRIAGEGYPLGRQHGALLRAEVREMVRALRQEVVGSAASRDLLLLKAWKLDAHIPARYRLEMRGIADGAGVEYADVLLLNSYDDLAHLFACSSAVLLPEGAHPTPLRHARNLDYPIPALAQHKLVLDLVTRGVTLRTVGFPGYIGVLTGMSSRGLGLSSHTSAAQRNQIGTPSGLVYRQLLEEGQSLQELQALLARSDRTIGNNLALSDVRSGTAVALEFDAWHLAARAPQAGRLLVTNHFQMAEMQRHQNPVLFDERSGSSARIACLAHRLPAGLPITPSVLQEAMSERGGEHGWRTPSNPGTVQSAIMEPATGHLWVATGLLPPVTQGGYQELPGIWRAERLPQ